MGCIYSHAGNCSMFSEDEVDGRPTGCDVGGGCMVEDDPVPADNCEYYESDSTCWKCGADYNQDEDCTCGDEDA